VHVNVLRNKPLVATLGAQVHSGLPQPFARSSADSVR
jgi:hypothetical protein